MSSIEAVRADDLAFRLFDEVITPLSATPIGQEHRRRFVEGFRPAAESYFERPDLTVMSGGASDFPGGSGVDGLVDALTASWEDRGESDLARLGPRLLEIARALQEENVQAGGDVDIFCYTMF